MAASDRDLIERIRERVPLDELVAEYGVRLERRGSRFVGLCPFHDEKTPSFSVDVEKGVYHCFGCREGGDLFRFVMKKEGIDFPEAVAELAERAGLEVQRRTSGDGGRRKRLLAVLEGAARFYRERLAAAEGARARRYLEGRGLDRGVLEAFGFGWAPDRWSALRDTLVQQGYRDEELVRAGIAKRGARGVYDLLRGRIVLPIRDERGRTVSFGGRILEGDAPKYINGPETELFSKRRLLFGFDRAREAASKEGEWWIVEGYMDVVALHARGFRHAVGVLGTGFTPEQARLLRRYAGRVVLLFDGDDAGARAALRCGATLLQEGVDADVVVLPAGFDPDEALREEGAEAFRSRIQESRQGFLTHCVRREQRALGRDAGPAAQEAAIKRVLALVAGVSDELRRERALSVVAGGFGVSEVMLRRFVASLPARGRHPSPKEAVRAPEDGQRPRRRARLPGWELDESFVLRAAVADGETARAVVEKLEGSDFRDPARRRVFEAIRRRVEAGGGVTISLVSESLRDDEARRALEECLSREPPEGESLDQVCARVLSRRESERYRLLRQRLVQGEGDADDELLRQVVLFHRRRAGFQEGGPPEAEST